MEKQSHFILSAEILRAIGSVLIVFHHIIFITNPTDGSDLLIKNDFVKNNLNIGPQALNLLFVVSGLVIYYSLVQSNYTIRKFPKFILRRFTRILIPFWTTILIIAVLPFLFQTASFYSLKQLVANATLCVDFLDNEHWMNPIFITLKLEMIFYILVGLSAWFLRKNEYFLWAFTGIGLVLSYFYFKNDFMLKLPFFLMGMNITSYFINPSLKRLMPPMIIIFLYIGICYQWQDLASVLLALLILLVVKKPKNWIVWMGSRSYSLYLTHGVSIILVASLLFAKGYSIWMICLISIVSGTVFTELFYRIIEKPSIRWSKYFR